MKNRNALFLGELLSQELSLYAAMDVPLNEFGSEPAQSGEGVVHSPETKRVRWNRFREMGLSVMSPDDRFRFGQCVDVVQIERSGEDILPPGFIVPVDGPSPVVKEILVSTQSNSAFETSGNQANLWLGAYSEFKYQGFMGTIDREFVERSKGRLHERNDKFLVEIEQSRCYGVLELVQLVGDSMWKALLHLPSEPTTELNGIDCFSVHRIGIDGIDAVFRQRFATVSTVQAAIETTSSS